MGTGFASPAIDLEAFAERSRLCGLYFPKIAVRGSVSRRKLICDLARKLFDSWARRRMVLVTSPESLNLYSSEQDGYLSMIVFPSIEAIEFDEADHEAINLTIAGCKRNWMAKATDRAIKIKDGPPDSFRALEGEIINCLPLAGRSSARRRLRIAEAQAEVAFLTERQAGEWRANTISRACTSDAIGPGVPPPQDVAVLEYAAARLKAISDLAFSALGESFGPADMIENVERAVTLLSNLCVVKVSAYEDASLPTNHGLRRHCRVSTANWIREQLLREIAPHEAKVWTVYCDQLSAGDQVDTAKTCEQLSTDRAACQIVCPKAHSVSTLISERATLLADYKAATGNPSSKKIWEAVNSNIHKPRFYEWLNGKLSAGSATTQNFERFLREKKLPIPPNS